MRKFDILVLIIGIIGAVSWVIISSKDGYKTNNATIVARNISVTSTIDGQVENSPPAVGEKVTLNELLVRIQNGRFDRSRLVEFESRVVYLKSEIENIRTQQAELQLLLKKFKARARSYSHWLLADARLKQLENNARLEVARSRDKLKNQELQRATQLYKKKLTSDANMQLAKIEMTIASKQLTLSKAQFSRSELMLASLESDGVFFENGDTSYWAKMDDTVQVRYLDNVAKLATLKLQLDQAGVQAAVEGARINSSFAEEHRAPFSGVVNASYVTRGTRVTTGTNLYQILDCTQPVIIIPIPDNRISEFSVGLNVTVYPTDSVEALPGKISYVTSGALIGNDASIQIEQGLILRGNRAIVKLDQNPQSGQGQSCETARKAVVVIHTESTFDNVVAWVSTNMPEIASWISATSSMAADKMDRMLKGEQA